MNSVPILSVAEVVNSLENIFPSRAAEDWDNVGLLIGNPNLMVSGAVISIDLTFEAIELATQHRYPLIIQHHPCLFPKTKALNRILSGTPVYEALQRGIAVVACHTNFDQCSLEVPKTIASHLGLQIRGRFLDHPNDSLVKLVTFIPKSHLEQVRIALFAAGAGHVGQYDSCAFTVEGRGTFRGNEATHPFIGRPGRLENTEECRLETLFPRGIQNFILKALKDSHPYEEIAYDLYSVEQTMTENSFIRGLGYGFWGEFPSPRAFSDVAKDVKSLFHIHGFWITNPTPFQVTRVGFVPGKGASFVKAASRVKCDLFITGEAGYHAALEGLNQGVAVMELGHRESEKFFVETMKKTLSGFGLGFVEVQTPTQKIWQEE